MSDKDYLSRVYDVSGDDATRSLYDDWAETYDCDLEEAGYATPARIAAMLTRMRPDRSAPVLDFGCGTGLAGQRMHERGYALIDGCDMSEGMLARARARGVYRDLWCSAPGAALPRGRHAAIVASGVISKGAAPAEALDPLVAALGHGAVLIFSYNSHTIGDPVYEAKLAELAGPLRLIATETGDHLPEIGLTSTIYAFEKP